MQIFMTKLLASHFNAIIFKAYIISHKTSQSFQLDAKVDSMVAYEYL